MRTVIPTYNPESVTVRRVDGIITVLADGEEVYHNVQSTGWRDRYGSRVTRRMTKFLDALPLETPQP